ncbi:MAG TPA: acyltransferase family protein [Polyangiales bacterium]
MNSASGFRYIPALDGMRAIAVLAVVLYHADVAWLPGGYLGVELFFVVSGFLITSLLQSERAQSGRNDWLAFWKRRARRLFPALWGVLLLVPAYAAWRLPEELFGLRNDVLSALFYVTNWQLIVAEQSYFEQIGRPSLLQHLWSLAVEEQFYLLWPVAFSLICSRAGTRASTLWAKLPVRRVSLGLGLAALASALCMALLYDPGRDPSRVYYGSDTRAFGILFGASLAFARPWLTRVTPRAERPPFARPEASAETWVALLALLGLSYAFVALDELSPFVYPYGLLCIDLCTCALIVCVLRMPAAGPVRLLSSAPLVALGKRSYSLYLWHWPVVAATRPGVDVELDGVGLLALRMALTAALAEASYRLVETPLRSGRWFSLPRWQWSAPLVRPYATALLALLLITFSAGALISAQEPPPPDLTLAAPARGLMPASGQVLATSTALLGSVDRPPTRVLAIGDSVMLGARKFLRSEAALVEVDAEVGRTPLTTLALLKRRKAQQALGDVVIIHLGNNGPFQHEQFDQMMELLGDVPHVVFVTAKVPRRLGVFNNRTIREGVARHPRAALIDWFAAAQGHDKWFREDGLHLRESGATEYARMLAAHYLPPAAGAVR